MKRVALGVAMLAFGAAFAAPANAAVFDFSYTGGGNTASGTFTTGAANPSGSFFTPSLQITGITGTFDGSAITSLLAPGTFYQNNPTGLFGDPGSDNILYYNSASGASQTHLDRYGVSFTTATLDVNLFLSGTTYGLITEPIGGGDVSSFLTGKLTVTPIAAAVPEPSTWAMMILGFFGLGFMAYRKKRGAASFRLA